MAHGVVSNKTVLMFFRPSDNVDDSERRHSHKNFTR